MNPAPPLDFCSGILNEVMADWRVGGTLSEGSSVYVSLFALDVAIVEKIQHVIDFVIDFYHGTEELNRATSTRKLTPLHVAALNCDIETARKLLKSGARVDSADSKGWRPLHHAALMGHKAMMELFLSRGADRTCQNSDGGTCDDILRLTASPSTELGERIPLFWKGADGRECQMRRGDFKERTSADFTEEVVCSKGMLAGGWFTGTFIPNSYYLNGEIKAAYLGSAGAPPCHLLANVTRDSMGKHLQVSPGLGLFARRVVEPKEIIGEYCGVFCAANAQGVYAMGHIDALRVRNAMAEINDGFPNVMVIGIDQARGIPERNIAVAMEQIRPGEQFCMDYGCSHSIKGGPYVELRPRELRAFIKEKIDEDELIRCAQAYENGVTLPFADLMVGQKFLYLLNTPLLLFTLSFEGLLSPERAEKWSGLVRGQPRGLELLPRAVRSSLEIKNKILVELPRSRAVYAERVLDLPGRVGFFCSMKILNGRNKWIGDHAERGELSRDADEKFTEALGRAFLKDTEYALAFMKKG